MAHRTTFMAIAAIALSVGCVVEEAESDGAEFRDAGVFVVPPDVAKIEAPLPEAFCEIHVTGQEDFDIETNYLPRIVFCENGGADFEALKAQAIAARSVTYYEAALDGSICDSQACQHASCKGSAAATLAEVPEEVFRAVEETSGMYLMYEGTLTYGFYVAGSQTFQTGTCEGVEGGAATEKWVTYNDGLDGHDVEQTRLGSRFDPDDAEYGQNRGCMSQWGARCLEKDGADALDILHYYYGEDIEIVQAPGLCVDEDATLDAVAVCGDDVCSGRENEDNCEQDCEPCGKVASDDKTIIEEADGCFHRDGDPKYFRDESEGHDDELIWTLSTENVAYNIGTWRFNFEKAGDYKVEAYVEEDWGEERYARYRLVHDGEETDLRVDQARSRGWISLGVFDFESGHRDQSLTLTDLSGDRGNKIIFDAVRLTPVRTTEREEPKYDAASGGTRGDTEAGCSVGASRGGGGFGLAFACLLLAWRRRPSESAFCT